MLFLKEAASPTPQSPWQVFQDLDSTLSTIPCQVGMEVVDNLDLHLPLFTSPGVQLMNQVAKEVVDNKDLDFPDWSSTPCLL